MKNKTVFTAFIAVLLLITRIPALLTRFVEVDEAVYATVANIILNGGTPYFDGIDHKPPMIFYIYAMVFSWFGRGNMFAVHFFSLLVTALTSFYIYRILLLIKKATHQENERTALWGACLFVCFSGAFLYEVMSANTEVFLNLFLTLSAYIFFKNYKTTKPIHSLAIGLLIAASFITKQVGGIMLPILCVGSLLKHKRALRRGVMESALITSGFMLGVALSFAFFYQKNLAHEYFYWVFWEPWSYAGNGYVQPRLLMRILTRCVAILLSWFFLWSLASRSIFNKVRTLDDKLITVVLWLIGMMFVVSLGGRFLWHYFTICVPPLAILAAPEIERTKRFWVYLGIAAPLVVFSFVFLFIDRIDNRSEKFNSYAKVADYVKKHTTANDKILVWGYGSEIYVLSDRNPATRHFISDFITGIALGFGEATYKWRPHRGAIAEVQSDFSRNGIPKLIIDTTHVGLHGYDGFPMVENEFFGPFVKSNYHKEVSIDNFDIYKVNTN